MGIFSSKSKKSATTASEPAPAAAAAAKPAKAPKKAKTTEAAGPATVAATASSSSRKSSTASDKHAEHGGGGGGHRRATESQLTPEARDRCQRFREQASQHAKRRGELYEESRKAYDEGRKAEAKQLSEEGKREGELMKQANHDALKEILGEQDLTSGTVDLHGLQLAEALEVVRDFLEMHAPGKKETKAVTIITGAGNHSGPAGPKIKPAVEKILKEKRGCTYEVETSGSYRVTLTG